jgi:hypothetical protein
MPTGGGYVALVPDYGTGGYVAVSGAGMISGAIQRQNIYDACMEANGMVAATPSGQ